MKANVGNTDKLIRIILAIVLGTLYLTNTVSGVLGIVVLVFAIILVATSLISFCPIYPLFSINTCPNKNKKP
ncbi:DUF2892 domain-containing protein [Flavobacterium piscinae]|uniref:DUF2892 domain-containing protein n=1 Tax=Flavobacterium piscinae TaxID=2506424 RepID=A0A4Q1KJ98_9FLAO|nr:DUF2892 domain-containing protein [Flavobacterium piscinae]MBC8883063.1 DUF2892 domain-containing protein [Flavobacterium piscinae]RXR29420.1 DUF2892 domain-containing protein [Flavobacterium piscinae]